MRWNGSLGAWPNVRFGSNADVSTGPGTQVAPTSAIGQKRTLRSVPFPLELLEQPVSGAASEDENREIERGLEAEENGTFREADQIAPSCRAIDSSGDHSDSEGSGTQRGYAGEQKRPNELCHWSPHHDQSAMGRKRTLAPAHQYRSTPRLPSAAGGRCSRRIAQQPLLAKCGGKRGTLEGVDAIGGP
jgi:hypothetical protein